MTYRVSRHSLVCCYCTTVNFRSLASSLIRLRGWHRTPHWSLTLIAWPAWLHRRSTPTSSSRKSQGWRRNPTGEGMCWRVFGGRRDASGICDRVSRGWQISFSDFSGRVSRVVAKSISPTSPKPGRVHQQRVQITVAGTDNSPSCICMAGCGAHSALYRNGAVNAGQIASSWSFQRRSLVMRRPPVSR